MKKKLLLAVLSILSSALLFAGSTSAATWIDRYTSGVRNWVSIAASSDGSRLIAGDTTGLAYLYTSSDSGANWTSRPAAGARAWVSVASSSDGMKLSAVTKGTSVYTSTDGGATWTTRTITGALHLQGIASSSDGMKLVAVDGGGYLGSIYTSTDGGATWTARPSAGTRTWNFVTSSSDGLRLAAVTTSNVIYTSTDGGATWTTRTITAAHATNAFFAIASSADGMKLATGDYSYGYVYTSTDGGLTWTQRTGAGARNWVGVSYSGDGTDLAVADHFGSIYTSTNDGATWTTETGAGVRDWETLVHSYDGSFIAAGPIAGDIWTTGASTSGGATPPSVLTTSATAVSSTSATLNGSLTSLGSATPASAGFEYGPTTAYGVSIVASPALSTPGAFTKPVTGLACGTLYHYRAYATTTAGTGYGADLTFTTTACTTTITVPTVITNPATAVGTTTATINGTLVSNGGSPTLTVGFNRGTTTSMSMGSSIPGVFAPGPFYVALTGLSCNTTYYFQALSNNSVGYGYGSMLSFTTLPCPITPTIPVVTTVSATAITTTSVTFNGSIVSLVPNATTIGFWYSPTVTTTTGSDPSVTQSGSGTFGGPGPYTRTLSGLTCGTAYNFRFWATNTAGTGYGLNMPFTTSACPVGLPVVTTDPASSVTGSSAIMNGTVVSLGGAPIVNMGFYYGTTTAYGTTYAVGSTVVTPSMFGHILSALPCGTTYHYQAYATNSTGTATGVDRTFTTSACLVSAPSVITTAATGVSATTATLNGDILSTGGSAVTDRGFQYGTTTSYGSTATSTGSFGTGAFSNSVTGLTCGTLYHFRAYATNTAGTSYGADMTFATGGCTVSMPSVITTAATAVTTTSATLNGDILSTGGAPVTTRGFHYGLTTSYGTTTTSTGAFGTGAFSTTVGSLTCGTTYHFRAYATNTAGTSYGADMSFTTTVCPIAPPVVVTNAATGVGSTAATLRGTLSAIGTGSSSASVGFEYGTTTAYGTTIAVSTMYGTGSYSSYVSTLSCGTTYHYRAKATNSLGASATGADMTFTTTACLGAPSVVTVSATSITTSSATLNGNLTSNGGDPATSTFFAYGLTTSYSGSTSGVTTPVGAFSQPISGLSCGTTYHFQAGAINASGTVSGADLTFTTSACPIGMPSVSTNAATSLGTTGATLNGTLLGLGGASSATTGFQYGLTTSYGSTAAYGSMSFTGGFASSVTGLTCGTLYHFRAYATNTAGTAYGGDMSFTTSACPVGIPSVTTTAATGISTSAATLNGAIASTGGANATVVGFEYGLSTSYGSTASSTGSFGVGAFSKAISGLTCNTLYHFRAYATNSAGTGYGSDLTFTTSACPATLPTVVTNAATSVSVSTATLNGSITATGGANATVTGFQYGTTTGYGSTISSTGSFGVGAFSNAVTSLACNTLYHFRAYATNTAGTAYGGDMTFTTLPCNPSVVTISGNIVGTMGTLVGDLTSLGAGATSATVGFHYGPTTAYGYTTTLTTPRTTTGTFSKNIVMPGGTTCNNFWHLEAWAVNSNGVTVTGGDKIFCF